MKRICLGLTLIGGAGLIMLWWLLHPSRPGGFGHIGLDRELAWRKKVGLPTNDPGLPAQESEASKDGKEATNRQATKGSST